MPERRRLSSVLFSWRGILLLVLWGGSLAAAGLAGALAYRHRADIRAVLSDVQGGGIIETNLYNLRVRKLSVQAHGRDGGIAPLDDGILFANRLGRMWFVEPDLSQREVGVRVPINSDAFEADPYNVNTNRRDQFAVKDLMAQQGTADVRLLASYNYWYEDDDCYVLRVSSLRTTSDAIQSGATDGGWKTVFETECRPLTRNPDGVHRNPTNGAGGRLAPVAEDRIMLTVGGFGPDTPIDPTNSFGKTIVLDLARDTSWIHSWGHRNSQGLAVASSGEIWLTEHGDRGGDELNRVRQGAHYGFPYVSYGTEYESMVWSKSPRQGRHEGYEKPMFSWVPSIATSQVMVVERDLFEHWRGDIIVSTLAARSLFRVRVEDDRVIFVEPIPIGHRIRDVAEATDGTIVMKTDDDLLVFLDPVGDSSSDWADLDPLSRGRLLAGGCLGCHTVEPDGVDGIGPSLWGVVGRRVAAQDGYAYSDALRTLDGRWSADLLRAFLEDPAAVAPGTTMQMTTEYSDQEIEDLITYLESLR